MMRLSHVRLAPPTWLRLPRRTARLRLSALYGGLFLLSGVGLLAATYVLFEHATEYKAPRLPKVPSTPSIQDLQPLLAGGKGGLTLNASELLQAQYELGRAQHAIANGPKSIVLGGPIRTELAQAQLALTKGQRQLAQAIHQLAQVGPVQASQRAADSHELLVTSGIALAAVALLALLVGWFVSGRMLRPVRVITRTARRISSTSLHERLALSGPEDEFKELGDTLDDLFGRLDAAFDAQRHFVANASHELRTPLTRERALVQVALGDPSTSEVWRSTGQELLVSNREQETLIDALLTLASSEGGLNDRETFDLAAVVSAVLGDLQSEIDQMGTHVEANLSAAPLEGDPLLVERLVANLLTNAVRHNVVGGRIEVTTGLLGSKPSLSVANTGPLISPTEIERLFQPFQRLDPGRAHHREGHGLGLSIVRAIASAHGAVVFTRPRPEGGLVVEVTFPPFTER